MRAHYVIAPDVADRVRCEIANAGTLPSLDILQAMMREAADRAAKRNDRASVRAHRHVASLLEIAAAMLSDDC